MGVVNNGFPYVDSGDIVQRRWQNPADADRMILVDENGNVINADNPLATSASLSISGDIQIGAVEIKDGITDNRAEVTSDNRLKTSTIITSGNVFLTDDSGAAIGNSNPLPIIKGFDIPVYNAITLTYVVSGNGTGEVETVSYKNGATVLASLTLAYDSNDNLIGVIQT